MTTSPATTVLTASGVKCPIIGVLKGGRPVDGTAVAAVRRIRGTSRDTRVPPPVVAADGVPRFLLLGVHSAHQAVSWLLGASWAFTLVSHPFCFQIADAKCRFLAALARLHPRRCAAINR